MTKPKCAKRSAGSTTFTITRQDERFVETGWLYNEDEKAFKQVKTKHDRRSKKIRLLNMFKKADY